MRQLFDDGQIISQITSNSRHYLFAGLGMGMQKKREKNNNIILTAFSSQSTFLCASNLHKGTCGEYKHIASENRVFFSLQATRAALTAPNKTGHICNVTEETQKPDSEI